MLNRIDNGAKNDTVPTRLGGTMYIFIGIATSVALCVSFGIHRTWKSRRRIKRGREYVQSKILNAFRGPTGLITMNFKQIADACVTDWVTVDEVRMELDRLVDEERVIRQGDWDFGFAYWLPETAQTTETSTVQAAS